MKANIPEPMAGHISGHTAARTAGHLSSLSSAPPHTALRRRHALAWLALAASGARAATEAKDGAPQPPLLSTAPLGDALPAGWTHQRLPKVERANRYDMVDDAGRHVLRVRSAASASSLICRTDADPACTPLLQWQWKVARALAGSDVRTKGGDDYAARLYVFFDLPVARLSFGDRFALQAARALSGADIPAAALCYVWGQAQPAGTSAWNPYTDRVRMVVVDSGDAQATTWRSHTRDLRRDWAEAFGGPVPRVGGFGLGADTDNTGDNAEAWFGDLRLAAAP